MSITNAARRFEQRFDAKAECFIWHHPLLGFISIFVGMPLLVWRVSVSVRSLSPFLWHGFWVGCNLYFIFKRTKDY